MALNFANNNSLSAITSLPASISGGAMTLISTQTASSSANISFTSGIDDTYDEYVFKFYDIHPASQQHFQFNVSIDGGSNYNVAKTTTSFGAYHTEADDATSLNYKTAHDLAQGTGYQILSVNGQVGADADMCFSGTLKLFSPSSTTFVKHFISSSNHVDGGPTSLNAFVAGYANTTSAVNAVNFQMASGNIDSGVIKLYGVS
jgi:hypothetical protein